MAQEIYVAVNGDDAGAGTQSAPLASIAGAQLKARELIQVMKSDVHICLEEGTYFLSSPLELVGELDAGRNGHQVIYQPVGYGTPQQASVTVSGGQRITGWELWDEGKNVWVAQVGKLQARQLFVQGRRASRASTTDIPASLVKTEAGYTLNPDDAKLLAGPGNLECVYTGIYPWSEARIGIEAAKQEAAGSTLIMKQPAFAWAEKVYQAHTPEDKKFPGLNYNGLERPTRIENSLSLLDTPGSFVFDSSRRNQHKLYYIPRDDEDMTEAEVIAPVLERLVHGVGSTNFPLRNVTFRGLKFAHATWLQPGGSNGFLHYHGATYYNGSGELMKVAWTEGATVMVPMDTETTPCALHFEQSRAITFADNIFTQFGTGALSFAAGCSFNTVSGNVFTDISATPLIIGSTTDDTALRADTRHNLIENNWIHHTGKEFAGSSALFATETQSTVIRHNQINDVPHVGISIYGGDTQRNVTITHNLVYNSMQVLADGGAITLASPQGTSPDDAGIVSGNVIRDVITSYNFGLYTDYGASWLKITDNIIYGSDTPVVLEVMPPLRYVTFENNFWDRLPPAYENPPESVTLKGNTLLKGPDMAAAIAANPTASRIAAEAGIEHSQKLRKEAQA